VAAAIASGVGKARPLHPSAGAPAAGSPRCSTRAVTILVVRAQEQFVVHTVLTTSSNTVGLRIIRPAPDTTQDSSGSSAASS
jgi:hypothetical protein